MLVFIPGPATGPVWEQFDVPVPEELERAKRSWMLKVTFAAGTRQGGCVLGEDEPFLVDASGEELMFLACVERERC